MGIVFNSKLSSSVANATWLDKTQNDITVGALGLNDGNSTQVTSAQIEINKSKRVIFGEASKLNGDQLTPNAYSMDQEFRLVGNGGAVTLNALPFASQPIDGTIITLVGHDDTNSVTISFNDSQYGCYINGDATLKRGCTLTLIYNDELERYLERSRNI